MCCSGARRVPQPRALLKQGAQTTVHTVDSSCAVGEDHAACKVSTRFLALSEILFYKGSLQAAQTLQLQLQRCLAEDRHPNSMSHAAVRAAWGSLVARDWSRVPRIAAWLSGCSTAEHEEAISSSSFLFPSFLPSPGSHGSFGRIRRAARGSLPGKQPVPQRESSCKFASRSLPLPAGSPVLPKPPR